MQMTYELLLVRYCCNPGTMQHAHNYASRSNHYAASLVCSHKYRDSNVTEGSQKDHQLNQLYSDE